jgi:cyclopropane-fatty-acyl-phospholipid synthase
VPNDRLADTLAPLAARLGERVPGGLPYGLRLWDGSELKPTSAEAAGTLDVRGPKAVRYLISQPNELGIGRAWVSGELDFDGDLERAIRAGERFRGLRLSVLDRLTALRAAVKLGALRARAAPPAAEARLRGRLHSLSRDRQAVRHHYDVSNRFYELVLGPSMAYTCAVFPKLDASLEEAQEEKFDLVARKLALEPRMRLLDVGCGWGGMVRHAVKHYGVTAVGVTLSANQARWAQAAIERDGIDQRAQVLHRDYRDAPGDQYDAVSSIGLLEHVGVNNYASYFDFLRGKLRDGGRLLNHCITRPSNNQKASPGAFIDRYVFPDGELTGSGRIISAAQDSGFEVRHEENLREHYALTLKRWCANLVTNWDECVAEVGEGTARVWGLYMAGSRYGFETNEVQLHQVLAVKPHTDGNADWPLRPTWAS